MYAVPEGCPPKAMPRTLHQLLKMTPATDGSSRPLPSLEDRYQLAVVLASSLYTFMLSHWHHKRFHSGSIFFLSEITDVYSGTPDITVPYVGGYAVSRPDAPAEDTFLGLPVQEAEMYLHPEYRAEPKKPRPRFRRAFETYAFGILLAEIGFWNSLPYIALNKNERKQTISPPDLRTKLTYACKTKLACWMGKRYRDVTLECLNVELEGGVGDSLNDFYLDIVLELTKCVPGE